MQAADATEPDKATAATASQQAHSSGVAAVAVSPFFDDLVASVGGWDWALWQVDRLEAPLMRSAAAPCTYTCLAWSTTRPGARLVKFVFFFLLEWLWDSQGLLQRANEQGLKTVSYPL